jgi:LppX_LprAFG lipoprotein
VLLRRTAFALLAALLALPVLVGCGGGGSSESAPDLLARAKKTLDSAKTVHFVLSSTGAPAFGTVLTGGEGDIARPASFRGTLKVQANGTTVDLKVVSIAGKIYAQLPFAPSYSLIDPAAFGFGDPGKLLDPNSGISQLLPATTNAQLGSEKRVSGEVVREVTGDLPGSLVERLLTSKDPSKPVHARYSIAADSGQLRRAALTGPFFVAGKDATYTLDLSTFGADVTITAPPTG